MRALLHYIAAVLIMALYGGQLCPFISTLPVHHWTLKIVAAAVPVFLVRLGLQWQLVDRAEPAKRMGRQFWLEMGCYVAVALLASAFNRYTHEFPLGSTARMAVSFAVLGVFAGLDLALQRERRVVRQLTDQGQDMPASASPGSLVRRFVLVGSLVTISIIAAFFLIVTTDLYWAADELQKQGNPLEHFSSIVMELAFLCGVILALVINLIFSYSRNLKIYFQNENGVLEAVSGGDLYAKVPVTTRDEFGVMADYTNRMIGALRQRTHELQNTQDVTIVALASLAETRDNETGAHILRTQNYVRALAACLARQPAFAESLDDEKVELLYKSAPLHDIGKVGVPDAILLKPGKLTDEEWVTMRKHTVYGRDALQSALDRLGQNSFLKLAQEIAYSHHEKWDGSGYPQGLSGEAIPLSGRLMALADVYDALISARVYKPAFPHEKARSIIMEGRDKHFDPAVVDAFVAVEVQFQTIAARFQDGEELEKAA